MKRNIKMISPQADLDNDLFLRSVFLQALPITTRQNLTMQPDQKLTNLATLVDRLHQLDKDTMSVKLIAPSRDSPSELMQVIAVLRAEIHVIKQATNATQNTDALA